MLRPKKPNFGFCTLAKRPITIRLAIAPARLSQKAVVPKVAVRKEPKSTRNMEIAKDELTPYSSNAANVTTLARPKRTPTRGRGGIRIASIKWKTRARARKKAIFVSFSVGEGMVFPLP
jgi:hypothetical protein